VERSDLRIALVCFTATLLGCSDLPSKGDALDLVKQGVKEDATCTLPIATLSKLKMQHASKAICVPQEAAATMACLDALTAAGMTKPMPPGYMAEWPDEVSGAGFDSVSPYDRRARALLFKGCVELTPGLREGQFRCGEASADKVVRMTKTDETHASVRYARALTLDSRLAAIETACGAVGRPAPEGNVTLAKVDDKWAISKDPEPASSR
jgi:hypothetical protein